jgi:hypothetical protein
VNGIPVIQKSEPPPLLAEIVKQERERDARFGQVKRGVHANWRGQKLVVVGREVFHSSKWKTPADFLFDYLRHAMTPTWGQAELAKPLADRHPVMQWYDATCRLQARAKEQAGTDGIFGVVPSGAMRAYMLLAFDLYALQHHNALHDRLLHRLRDRDQYQGARHELFAAATCIRAGFDIEHEDELDRTSGHVEFTATHRRTGVSFSVEAKSKHRDGVLGRPGDREADDEVRTRLGRLVNDALRKPRQHPLVLFLDLNLPPTSPAPVDPGWLEQFVNPIVRRNDREGKEDPWDLLVFSNQPDHYTANDAPAPRGYAVGLFGKNARIGTQPPEELVALYEAANKFGVLPNSFDEM